MPKSPDLSKPLRLWPGALIIVLQWLLRYVLPVIKSETLLAGVIAVPAGLFLIWIWWGFFSRAPKIERWGAIILFIISIIVTKFFVHQSIAEGGMGVMFFILSIPHFCLVFVLWAVITKNLSNKVRRYTLVGALLLVCIAWTLVRIDGSNATLQQKYAWRWSMTPEEKILAGVADAPVVAPFMSVEVDSTLSWPGFRGQARDSKVFGSAVETDWETFPPRELWRRPVGPGWSSFAVSGDLLYTQEQLGEKEIVACYRVTTGEPVWKYSDQARFWETIGGAGPRSNPTLHNGRVYTMGATGILNVLDSRDGSLIWSRNAEADAGVKVPIWGYSGSPLVLDSTVIAAVSNALVCYDLQTGKPRWTLADSGDAYSSPQLSTIHDETQIVYQRGSGIVGIGPVDGKILWEHFWAGVPIVQPNLPGDNTVLVSMNENSGMRRLSLSKQGDTWAVTEGWTSTKIKPYFNDSVVHKGHVYGFHGTGITCVDLETGERLWKGGRYWRGQIVLLADQDLLLVVSEKGELALVKAVPDQFTELAKIPALEGKTWNHPVLVGNILLMRNGQEMAAFYLASIEK